MSRSGNSYDNAFAESFIKTLKRDEVYIWEYESFIDVAERIPYFIEEVYNRKRVHSGINYLPPVEILLQLMREFPPVRKRLLAAASPNSIHRRHAA